MLALRLGFQHQVEVYMYTLAFMFDCTLSANQCTNEMGQPSSALLRRHISFTIVIYNDNFYQLTTGMTGCFPWLNIVSVPVAASCVMIFQGMRVFLISISFYIFLQVGDVASDLEKV